MFLHSLNVKTPHFVLVLFVEKIQLALPGWKAQFNAWASSRVMCITPDAAAPYLRSRAALLKQLIDKDVDEMWDKLKALLSASATNATNAKASLVEPGSHISFLNQTRNVDLRRGSILPGAPFVAHLKHTHE